MEDLGIDFIRDGFDTPKLASAWLECRSLLARAAAAELAGDSERTLTDHTLHRLQAGSYKMKQQRA